MKSNQKGSITLEAALAFPIFFLSVLCLLTVLKAVYIHEIIEQSLYKSVNEIAVTNIINQTPTPQETFELFVNNNINQMSEVNLSNINANFITSSYTTNGQIKVEVRYDIRFPLGNIKFRVIQRAVIKDWEKNNYLSEETDNISDIWDLHPLKRGRKIQQMYNRDKDMPHNFPVVARFDDGMAISIKSINLNDKSYQKSNNAVRRIKGLINDLSEFEGGRVGNYEIHSSQITAKKLILVIPDNCLADKKSILDQCTIFAEQKSILIQIEGI